MKARAVVFGAGLLGCGLVGQALRAAGHDVTFVARDPAFVAHLNRVGGYRVRLADGAHVQEVEVSGVRALALADQDGVARAVAEADLVATAVGLDGLDGVVPALVAGGRARGRKPLNVLTFENGTEPAERLRALVAGQGADLPVFVAGAMAERIVSRRLGDPAGSEPLTFVADPAPGFAVDARRLGAPLPALPGMRLVENFTAAVHRKLALFSAGHVATAYLGALKGYRYVHAAIRDPQIRAVVAEALREGHAGLAACYGPEVAGDPAELDRVLHRYGNAALDDPVERVARDPRRKLAAGERITGTAVLAEEAGISPDALATVAAAALFFDRRTGGTDPIGEILTQVAAVSLDRGFGSRILDRYLELAPGAMPGNALLDIERRLWSTDSSPAEELEVLR